MSKNIIPSNVYHLTPAEVEAEEDELRRLAIEDFNKARQAYYDWKETSSITFFNKLESK